MVTQIGQRIMVRWFHRRTRSTLENGKTKWGFIDKTGKFVINPQFDYAREFHGRTRSVRVEDHRTGKCGYIDKTGKYVINPQFDLAGEFMDGLAPVGD